MLKKIVLFLMLLIPVVANSAPKKEKEEPIVHLTDAQISYSFPMMPRSPVWSLVVQARVT